MEEIPVIQCSTAIIGLLFALAGALGNQKHSKIQGEKVSFFDARRLFRSMAL